VDLQQLRVKYRDYLADSNRPILHRKELLVTEAYPLRRKFAGLTQQEEKRGLYENPERIGFEVGWQELLRERGLRIVGHRLVRASQS